MKEKRKENTLSTKKATKKKKSKNDNGQEKKENTLDQESKNKEKTIKTKKGRKWKTQHRIKHLASYFRYIQFGRVDKGQKLL